MYSLTSKSYCQAPSCVTLLNIPVDYLLDDIDGTRDRGGLAFTVFILSVTRFDRLILGDGGVRRRCGHRNGFLGCGNCRVVRFVVWILGC